MSSVRDLSPGVPRLTVDEIHALHLEEAKQHEVA